MTPEMKAAVEEMQRGWNEFQTEMKAAMPDPAKLKAIGDRLDQLETKMSRPGFGAAARETGNEISEEAKQRKAAVLTFCRKDSLDPSETKMLRADNDSTGGVFITADMETEILKEQAEYTDFDAIVRVRKTGKRSVRQAKRTGTFAARWVGEVEDRTETDGLRYSMEEIPVHESYAQVIVSRQDLEDSDYDLEAQINEEASEQFAIADGQAIVNGDGVKKPWGFMAESGVAEEITGAAADVTYDGFVKVSHNGNANYMVRGAFLLSLSTLGKARMLKDTTNMPIWAPMAEGTPPTILGRPYTIVPEMPAVGAGTYPVAFGDWKRAYTFVRRTGMTVLRDPFSQKNKGAVEIQIWRRVGGQVLRPYAIRKLKCSAS